MSADPVLIRLGERTARAVREVLEPFCPGQVGTGDVEILAAGAQPLGDFPLPCVASSLSGGALLVLTLPAAKRLAAAMMGMEEPAPGAVEELDELELSAVSEAMHQAMAAVAEAAGEVLGIEASTGRPVTRVLRAGDAVPAELCTPAPHAIATVLSVLGEPARLVGLVPDGVTVRGTAALDDLGIEVGLRSGDASAHPVLSGITMRLTAELGRARMRAGRAVAMPPGTVVELDADVDAPIDLLVNGVRLARARLLVTDDGEWAVRVEDVVPPMPS